MKFPKAVFLSSVSLMLFSLISFIYFTHDKTTKDVTTLNILTPSWISEKFSLEEASLEFMRKNPEVRVNIDKYNNYDTSYYPLISKSNQNKYDIILGGGREHIVPFALSDKIINFDREFFDEDLKKEDFFPSFLELGNINGKQYMIPLMGEMMSLVIRKDLFEDAGLTDKDGHAIPPKNWDELYLYAKKLTTVNQSGQKIYGINIDFGNNLLLYSFFSSLQSIKGNIYDDNYTNVDVSSSNVKYLLGIWQKLVNDGLAPAYTFNDLEYGRSNFKAGNVAMLLSAHSRWTEITPLLGDKKVGILPLPGSDKNGSLAYIHGITIPSSSNNKELAMSFIKQILLSRSFQAEAMKKYGKIPSLIRNYEINLSPEWDNILNWVRNAITLPISKDWSKIDKILQVEIQNCVVEKQSVEQTVTIMKRELDGINKSQ